ncbi:hypothetical protein FOS14_04370 [Skermania sp. ID1734]|uniref:hypothetical protein n=1 Tax=Skermania sp. ID1734 TaxID=2597516 RepID=UPI00117E182F|nr:hypothetical protein [Skermania sp. ID1734]TSE01003.1 hypothetical protein FOS14_04370 [Skermania sp. ID1734]
MSEPIPVERRRALDRGYTDAQLRRLTEREGWSRLRLGWYLPPELDATLDSVERHRELVRATMAAVSPHAVVSHQSATVLHGLTPWAVPLDRVHVTRDRPSGGRRTRGLHVHCAPFDTNEVLSIAGVRTLPLARALADIARTEPIDAAVVLGDMALRQGLCSRDDVLAALSYAEGRKGYPAARRAIALFDGRSESIGESRSRVLFERLCLPRPVLQEPFFDRQGSFIGRADFFFEEQGVIGEFDGKVKYGKHLREGEHAGEVVFREKLREDRLREQGWEVVRWTWQDLARPLALRDRILHAFARGLGGRAA